jgi:hypothetical protein
MRVKKGNSAETAEHFYYRTAVYFNLLGPPFNRSLFVFSGWVGCVFPLIFVTTTTTT